MIQFQGNFDARGELLTYLKDCDAGDIENLAPAMAG